MQHKPPKPPSYLTQLIDVLLIELTNWRWSWPSIVIIATLAPLFSILALGFFAQNATPVTLEYILVGNVVLSLMFGLLDKVQSHFIYMRYFGTLDYFATLPVRKALLVFGVMTGFFLITAPSVLAIILVGAWWLGLPIHLHPLLVVVLPLCASPLASLGALIGATARNHQEASAYTLLLTLAFTAIGPVVAAPTRLPAWLLLLGHFSPATYAASALRQTLLGPITAQLSLDLLVLVGFTLALFGLTLRWMDWRQR